MWLEEVLNMKLKSGKSSSNWLRKEGKSTTFFLLYYSCIWFLVIKFQTFYTWFTFMSILKEHKHEFFCSEFFCHFLMNILIFFVILHCQGTSKKQTRGWPWRCHMIWLVFYGRGSSAYSVKNTSIFFPLKIKCLN